MSIVSRRAVVRAMGVIMVALTSGFGLSGCAQSGGIPDGAADVVLMRADTESTRALRLAGALVILSHYAAHTPDSQGKAVLLHKQIQTVARRIGAMQKVAEEGAFFNTEVHYLAGDMIDLAAMVVPKTEVPKLLQASGDPLQFAARLLRVMRDIAKLGEVVYVGHNDLVDVQVGVLAKAKRVPAFMDDKAMAADEKIQASAAGFIRWGDSAAKQKLIDEFNKDTRIGYNIQPDTTFFRPAFASIERACRVWGSVTDDGQAINCKAAQAAFDCGYSGDAAQCKVRAFGS